MNQRDFKYIITGTLEGTVTDSDLAANGAWGKTLTPEVCRLFESHGVKNITTAALDSGNKNISYPVKVGAGV